MRKLLSLMLGLGIGAAAGAVLVMLLLPPSDEPFAARLKRSWDETLEEARQASARKRAALEAQLAQMQAARDRRAQPPTAR